MAVIPIIQQTWDTTSYVNPTRMNNIETNIGILSKATGIEYSSGVSVKDILTPTTTPIDRVGTYIAVASFAGQSGGFKLLNITIGSVSTQCPQNTYTNVGKVSGIYLPSVEQATLFENYYGNKFEVRIYTNGNIDIYNYSANKIDGNFVFPYI